MKKYIIVLIIAVSFIIPKAFTQETGTFKDSRDGKVYKTVKIGDQIWMAENLNYKISSFSWVYDNNPSNAAIYGRLYNWETAKGVCPPFNGWHLPSNAEWSKLTEYLGGEDIAGGKLKEEGTAHWKSPNKGATNETGFSAVPGGYRANDGGFGDIGENCYWWSATENFSILAWDRYLSYNLTKFTHGSFTKFRGFSVRCVKD